MEEDKHKDPEVQETSTVLNLYSQVFIIESDLKQLKIVYEPI